MYKSEVQYRYALNENNELIEVHDAHTLGGAYHCPQCGTRMIPKCGSKKKWHFAHSKVECDHNHYLHTIAELRIMEWFNSSKEILIVLPANDFCEEKSKCRFYDEDICCKVIDSDVFNLKDYYTICEKEKTYEKNSQRFVADLLCSPKNDNNEPLFIEICVTHPCEEEKLNSGIRIIEFVINSEDDIDNVIGKQIRTNEKVRLYNFHPRGKMSSPISYYRLLQKFIIDPYKKAHVKNIFCDEINDRQGNIEITFPLNGHESESMVYFEGFAIAIKYDKTLRHCCICSNYSIDTQFGLGRCNLKRTYFTKIELTQTDAQHCPRFLLNMELTQQIQNELNAWENQNGLDIWMNKEKIDIF